MGDRGRKSTNPEVQKAMDERDALLTDVAHAILKVDELQDELLKEYAQAESEDRWTRPPHSRG